MKKTYEKPTITIEQFPGDDVIVCSIIENPGDEDEIGFNNVGSNDS